MQQDADTGDHLFQARFPAEIYEWLRGQWFERRVTMTAVVVAAVEAARGKMLDLDEVVAAGTAEDGTHRFTVRLSQTDYEWLRLEAFQRRIPINQLLAASIEAYRHWSQGSSGADVGHGQSRG